jgi:hypothetical protein
MDSENVVLRKIKQQLDSVRVEYETVKAALDDVIARFASDIEANMKDYIAENIRRELRKSPEQADSLDDAKIEALRGELNETLEPEIGNLVETLRKSASWYDPDVAFLDLNSKIWKYVKSIEEPVNGILKKHGVGPIVLKNWTWLSADIDALITMKFPGAKKEFIDKSKQLRYLEARFQEESRLDGILNRLDSL